MHVRRFEQLSSSLLIAAFLFVAFPAGAALNERYLCLDGTDDYASAADHASLDVGTGANDDATFETFFYVPDTSNTTWDTLIWKNGSYGIYVLYNFSLAGGADRFIFRIWTGGGANDYVFLFADTNLSAGWHHVAGIWDNENTDSWDYVALYVDGALVASGSNVEITPGLMNTSSALQLGGVGGTNPAVGGLEETRISSAVRYSGSSYSVPSAPFTPDADTRALWHFDAAPGATSMTDSSGNGNTLTGFNGAQTCGVLCLTITVNPTTLPGGSHGVAYNQTIDASGGDAPYSFSVTDGSLPQGLTLSAGGSLSGTPSAAGSFEFEVTATDSNGCTGARTYSISISCPAITVTPATLPDGVTGSAYNTTIGATGGTPAYSFEITDGALPSGLTLSTGGSLTGTPSSTGSSQFTVTATDSQGCTGSSEYTLNVVAPNITVSPTSASVSESGTTDTFDVVLDNAPSGNVVVDINSTDTGEATVSHGQLTFTTGDWSVPQTVTVTGVDDVAVDGDQSVTITVTVNAGLTADSAYDALDPSDVSVTVQDDEVFAVLSTSPSANAGAAPRTADVDATASDPVDPLTVTAASFRVHGSQTGRISGTHSSAGASFQLDPADSFKPGETVHATATAAITNGSDVPLRPRVWQFTAATAVAPGALRPHATVPSFGAGDARSLALGDLDGDGDADALVGNYAEATTVWLNDGTGAFAQHPTNASFGWQETEKVVVGDLDADGDLDAIVCRRSMTQHVWLNSGAAVFTAHPTIAEFSTSNPLDVVLGDLDGDGDLDALVTHGTGAAGSVWLNGGSGDFTAHPVTPTFGTAASGESAALGDIDGDGDLDAVIANEDEEPETVWVNDGSGNFASHPTTPEFGQEQSRAVALGDLDGDGDLDAIVANENDLETVWRNDGSGNFSAHPVTPSFDAGVANYAVALGDLDGDGDLDTAIADWAGGSDPARIWRNDGAGNFTAFGNYSTDYNADVAFADLDGDADLDVMTAHSFGIAESVWLNGSPGILVTPVSGLETTEGGATSTFTVELLSYPMAVVTIQISSSDTGEGRVTHDGVGPTTSVAVSFHQTNWNVPQTITLTGFDDAVDDGDVAYTIVTAPATSSDPLYNGLNAADVAVLNRDDDGPPSFLTATATSTTQVTVSWGLVSGASGYEVHRATNKNGPFTIVGSPTAPPFIDTVPASNTTYIYKVRKSGGTAADFSPIDIATSIVFTDGDLSAVRIKAVHIEQLRTAVNAVRTAALLAAASFTDPAPLAGVRAKRAHIIELRTALDAARTSLGLPAVSYTDPTITANATVIKAAHVSNLRQGTQ